MATMGSRTLHQEILKNLTTEQHVEGKGRALFAMQDISIDEDVISILGPLVICLDIPRLKDTCYGCLGYKPSCQITEENFWGRKTKLQTCTGCHVVRYCSKVGLCNCSEYYNRCYFL